MENHANGRWWCVTACDMRQVLACQADFCRAMLCISAAIAGTRCLSVRLSVCHVRELRQNNKDIFEIFSPSGSQAILVFRAKRDGANPTGTPLTGASNARRYEKMTIFDQ